MKARLTTTDKPIGHTTRFNHNTIVYRYRRMYTTPLCRTGAPYTFSHTVSTNHSRRLVAKEPYVKAATIAPESDDVDDASPASSSDSASGGKAVQG